MSKYDLPTIDFDNIDVHDVKYLPLSFDADVLFVLSLVSMNAYNAYGCSMGNMDKMCDNHPWCTTKPTNIQNNFGHSFKRSSCVDYM